MGKKQSCSSRFVGISSSIHLNESVCVCVCVGGRCVCAQSDFEFKQQSPPKITTKQKKKGDNNNVGRPVLGGKTNVKDHVIFLLPL